MKLDTIPKEIKQKVIELYKTGYSYDNIGRYLDGINYKDIPNILKEAGVKPRTRKESMAVRNTLEPLN